MYPQFIGSSILFGAVALLPVSAQTAPASTAPGSGPHRVQAELLTTVKANKAKPNDPINARTVTPLTLPDGTVVPVGSTLFGHVIKAESDSVDQHASSIAVTFDSVELKKKTKVSVHISVVSAMASAPSGASGDKLVSPSSGPLPADHPLNGQAYNVVQDAPNLINDPTHGHSGISGGKANASRGGATAVHTGSIIGLPGVTLEIDDGPDAVSTFVSAKKNLQLDGGLQLMLVVVQ